MHVCALGNVIGRTCREFAVGAVHQERIANFFYGSMLSKKGLREAAKRGSGG
jgi:hypothetical protein